MEKFPAVVLGTPVSTPLGCRNNGPNVGIGTSAPFHRLHLVSPAAQDGLLEFSAGVKESAPTADSLLISCGGLKTLDLLAPLEKRLNVPVVSSQPHGLWNAVQLLGVDARVQGYGSVLAKG